MLYRLTPHALHDIDTLMFETAGRSGWEQSMRLQDSLFAAFDAIATTPGIGHLRTDLMPREIYFYYAKPYLILYRRDVPPVIGAVIHGARDIASLMADRPI